MRQLLLIICVGISSPSVNAADETIFYLQCEYSIRAKFDPDDASEVLVNKHYRIEIDEDGTANLWDRHHPCGVFQGEATDDWITVSCQVGHPEDTELRFQRRIELDRAGEIVYDYRLWGEEIKAFYQGVCKKVR